MTKTSTPTLPNPAAKHQRVLDAALTTFLRYGFRKTSMEEVARTAQVSRQLLYLHFAAKEDLFVAVVRHALETGLDATRRALASEKPLREQLIDSFFAWTGRHIDKNRCDFAELKEVCEELLGPAIADYEAQFLSLITAAISNHCEATNHSVNDINPRDIGETLYAAAYGIKHKSQSCDEFLTRFRTAAKVICTAIGD